MMRKITKTLALTAMVGAVAVCPSLAATSFVDTIGDGSKYQIGKELSRTVQLGFDAYPFSSDFTGVRPTYEPGVSPNPKSGVTDDGTTGVPCAQLWEAGSAGVINRVYGNYGQWIVQPFTPTTSGYVMFAKFIAQIRQTAGYNQGTGKTAYVDIIADGGSSIPSGIWSSSSPVAVDLTSAKLGKKVAAHGLKKYLSAGTTYWLVLAPVDTYGVGESDGLDYANVNFCVRSLCPDASKCGDAKISAKNGLGTLIGQPSRILGITLTGYPQLPTEGSPDEVKDLPDGTLVRLPSVVINGKTGGVWSGSFYVQDPDRTSGIRVVGSTSCAVGEMVDIIGTVTTIGGIEKAITLDTIETYNTNAVLAPVATNSKAIGNTAVAVGGYTFSGLESAGLLMKVAGTVANAGSGEFYIEDGGVPGGVKCIAPGMTIPTDGQHRAVTGVVSVQQSGSDVIPVLLVRQQSDISSPY